MRSESTTPPLLMTGASLGLLTVILYHFYTKSRNRNLPPLVSGWIPWVGCAVEFGKAPVKYIDEKRKELGPVFTLYVGGERLTFLFDREDFHYVFNNKVASLPLAYADLIERTASIKLNPGAIVAKHATIHDTIKGMLAPGKLHPFLHMIQRNFAATLDKLPPGEYELYSLVNDKATSCFLDALYGEGILPVHTKEFKKNLEVYMEQLQNASAKVPEFFFREFAAARTWLINTIDQAVKEIRSGKKENKEKRLIEKMWDVLDEKNCAGLCLLMTHVSLTNTIPILFWTLFFMLRDQRVMEKARKELKDVMGNNTEVTEQTLQSMPYIKNCIKEAIRLRAPATITARVTQSFEVKNMTVPVGDLLTISPFYNDRNPDLFSDCFKYSPERWEEKEKLRNGFLEDFTGFGRGRYICPGRWFSLMEIHVAVVLLLNRIECKPQTADVEFGYSRFIGSQLPTEPVTVQLKQLQNPTS